MFTYVKIINICFQVGFAHPVFFLKTFMFLYINHIFLSFFCLKVKFRPIPLAFLLVLLEEKTIMGSDANHV
jgi:hypothetical protein